MKQLTMIAALAVTTAMATPMLADNELPRGWKGMEDVYQCQPEEWFKNSQGNWQNPTCVAISGGGNPPAPVVLPPDEDDDEEEEPEDPPVDPEDPPVDPEDPVDPCACIPAETVEDLTTAQA